jgi:hypothetical protein
MDGPVLAATAIRLDALVALIDEPRDEAAWQDGLDLLAAAAGVKPAAMFADEFARWRGVAARFELRAAELAPWAPAAPEEFLPRWYLEASAARRARRKLLLLARSDDVLRRAALLSAKGRANAAEEAALLGYPRCCVETHHEMTLTLEREAAERVARDNPGDEARMIRLVAAGALPFIAPRPITPSRSTSVNLCASCVADPASPARHLERAYEELAICARYGARP